MEKNSMRLHGLDFIRVMACIMIVLHHSPLETEPSLGRCAVTIFIILSGFLAGHRGMERRSWALKDSVNLAWTLCVRIDVSER